MEQAIVYIVIVFIILSLYLNWFGSSFTFVLGVLTLGIAGVLSPAEILNGFANEQLVVIIVLLLIGDIIRAKGILNNFFERFVFKGATTYHNFKARMMFLIAGASAFLNNTPLIAVLLALYKKKNREKSRISFLPIIMFLVVGIIDAAVKLAQHSYVSEGDISLFTSLSFGLAGVIGVTSMVIQNTQWQRFTSSWVQIYGIL